HAQQGGKQLTHEEQRGGGIATVELVSHVERALHERLHRDAARPPDGLSHDGRNSLANVEKPIPYSVIVDAIVESARIGAFVEIAIRTIASLRVSHDKNGH